MKHDTESQVKIVKRLLKAGKKLTPLMMLNEYGIFRLAARVNDLRNDGMTIYSEMIFERPVKFARYSLTKPKTK